VVASSWGVAVSLNATTAFNIVEATTTCPLHPPTHTGLTPEIKSFVSPAE